MQAHKYIFLHHVSCTGKSPSVGGWRVKYSKSRRVGRLNLVIFFSGWITKLIFLYFNRVNDDVASLTTNLPQETVSLLRQPHIIGLHKESTIWIPLCHLDYVQHLTGIALPLLQTYGKLSRVFLFTRNSDFLQVKNFACIFFAKVFSVTKQRHKENRTSKELIPIKIV